ncbi:MAG: hypothetical protein IJ468_00205 [Lachnospiraceae bacterium]|nr:hypothetical protein [Lachnospiraceae bacterium]
MAFILERTEQFLNILKGTIEQERITISKVDFSESRDGSAGWKPFHEGSYLGSNDSWYRFRASFEIPEKYRDRHVKCRVLTGGKQGWNPLDPQFLVIRNGHVQQALDANHGTFDLSRCAGL